MMQPFDKDLPFKTKEAYRGLAEINGILHVERDYLSLEYEIKDSFVGALKSGTKRLEIPYLDLAKVTYVRGWFKSFFELKVKKIQLLNQFPAAKDGLITLKIKRRYKTEAEDIENYVNLRIAEMGLDELAE